MKQSLTVLGGWPLSGKTTVARGLSNKLNRHWIDADDLWVLCFGKPNPNPVTDEEKAKDAQEVRRTYQLLVAAAAKNLEMGRSVIISAPFSRQIGWSDVTEMLKQFPEVHLKAIWCRPTADSEAEIKARLAERQFGVNSWSSVNTQDRYLAGREKFETPPIPHLVLNTSPPHTPAQSIDLALLYVQGS
jgi:predicted kinase